MPEGLPGCNSWAACYVDPFLGAMAGATLYAVATTPEASARAL